LRDLTFKTSKGKGRGKGKREGRTKAIEETRKREGRKRGKVGEGQPKNSGSGLVYFQSCGATPTLFAYFV